MLEAAHVEIDVSDVLDLIGTAELDNPTLGEMEAIEAEALEVSDKQLEEEYENAKLDDPVRSTSRSRQDPAADAGGGA